MVPRALLDLPPAGCERHFVWQRRAHAFGAPSDTNAVLVDLAQRCD